MADIYDKEFTGSQTVIGEQPCRFEIYKLLIQLAEVLPVKATVVEKPETDTLTPSFLFKVKVPSE